MTEHPTRELAVLLHADVVGSTELVQLDETVAHRRIQDVFRRFSETITSHSGVPHEIRGDALVAGFTRASDAISASLAFQTSNAAHNEELDGDVRPVVRVGIAMGEVVIADNTVTGEGVVLAQRVEQLAEPGGVCIQGAAYETVPKRLPFHYENLGECVLKGFDEPVKVYSVSLRPGAVIPEPETRAKKDLKAKDLPDKPSIAVLPFLNISDDIEQEYFADGIAEEVITALSRFHWFFVISRQTSFIYRGPSIDPKRVANELRVRYILSGSVRRSGGRVRITAQLIEGTTGYQIWSDRYDREVDDVFAVQDEIAQRIIAAVAPESLSAEFRRTYRRAVSLCFSR